jgi:hypothetical protein
MTTQLTLDDDVYQAARAEAEALGKDLSDFVSDVLRRAPRATNGVRRITRNGLPVIVVPPATSAISPAAVRQSIEEDGF